MKYKKYPSYKDSGVEWLGEMPEHWNITKYNYVIEEKIKSRIQVSEAKEEPGDFRFFTCGEDILTYKDYLIKGSNLYMSTGGKSNIKYYDGYAAYSTDTYAFTSSMNNPKYLFYHIFRDNKVINDIYFTGMGLKHLDKNGFKSINILLPTNQEQKQIVTFLDNKIEKIDTLIKKQENLISNLIEKKQAVISHSITKGLDKNVLMKKIQIGYTDYIPNHWKLSTFKHVIQFITSGSRGWAKYYTEEGKIFFRITNLSRNNLNPKLNNIKRVTIPKETEGERGTIKIGDLLISITADLGSIAVADNSVLGAYVSQHVALARPIESLVSSRWLGYMMISTSSKEQFNSLAYGGAKVQLSLEDVQNIKIVIPPKLEQINITKYIDSKISKIDTLIKKATKSIKLLKEKRTALISAAVTGKIDVRELI